eukprot:Phypoly_transcript_02281.p1 GENE.Phypoly_transcript_02281~~Phypoly_transcript_02281.p1  ORF type:complete len:806 (+),score=63.06 Phypoly_transcript_02281:39-2420(+)
MDESSFSDNNIEYGYHGRLQALLEEEFARLRDITYLDHAGTTMYSEKQLQSAMQNLLTNTYGNPHSQSTCSSRTTECIEQVRDRILQFFNTSSKNYHVIFTSGCTDGLKKVAEWFPWNSSSAFVYSEESHNSVVGMREYALQKGASFHTVNPSDLSGRSGYKNLSNRLKELQLHDTKSFSKCNLLAFPGQCNFSGSKHQINEIASHVKKNFQNWRVLVDGASLVGTSPVDLSSGQIDFLVFSFHKMIGYPTGLGALIVRVDAAEDLVKSKTYFGGGTVEVSLAKERYHVLRAAPLGLEDGTLPFLNILAVPYGLECLSKLGMAQISAHVGSLTRYLIKMLRSYSHPNGTAVVKIYGHDVIGEVDVAYERYYGGIISFNLLQPDGSYIPYTEVEKLANLHKIQLRIGCFCNPGACHGRLGISDADARDNHSSGHVCWDDNALLNGRPTGAIRISLGYMSSFRDVQKFLNFIEENYVFINPANSYLMGVPYSHERVFVEKLVVYPIKSCSGFEVSEWKADGMGLQYDREWALVDSKGMYVNQKKVPKLCLVRPTIDIDNGFLHLDAENNPRLSLFLTEIPGSPTGESSVDFDEELSLRICGDNCAGFPYGKEVTQWFYAVTGAPNLVLVRKNPLKERASRLAATKMDLDDTNIRFSNESPFLLISKVSVRDVVSRITIKHDYIGESSFRANIVVDGGLVPYEEDDWNHISINGHTFQSLGGCNRCKMITIDQGRGTEGQEPLKTLAHYRRVNTGRILFGIHIAVCNEERKMMTVRVGDTVLRCGDAKKASRRNST